MRSSTSARIAARWSPGSGAGAQGFKCFYHGWSFHNDGRCATKARRGEYPPSFGRDGRQDLVCVPALSSYGDFWCVNFDAGAIPLDD